jgi:hypothetical protein
MQELSHIEFLSLLRQRGIEISVKEGRLQISAPTGGVDTEMRAELLRRKPELLQKLQFLPEPPRSEIVRAERNGKIPQTPAQQGMWLIDFFGPGNVAYNIPEAFLIDAAIDLKLLQSAVDRLLARHETLRTRFYEDGGELVQAVLPDVRSPVGFTDISDVPEHDRQRTLRDLIREHARQPFDLNQPPLVRFHLFQMSTNHNVIFFNIHHIISDRRSLAILQSELVVLYEAAAQNRPDGLPELPVQYSDYAIWASRQLMEGEMAGDIEYWKVKLAGAPPIFELPPSRPYPEERTAWGGTVPLALPVPVSAALVQISREEGATMYMTLLAAFAVLLSLETGKLDFCLGSPFTHRTQVETESIIGLFVNMLVFRCQFEGDPSFREILRRVRTTALEAYEHGDLPFQELVGALKPDLRSRRSPLFQIMFAFDSDVSTGKSGLVQLDTEPGTARFDLTLQLGETAEGISGWFEYCTDLYDAATIEQLSAKFLALLSELTQQPDQPLSRIPLAISANVKLTSIPETRQQHIGFWKGSIRKVAQHFSNRRQ